VSLFYIILSLVDILVHRSSFFSDAFNFNSLILNIHNKTLQRINLSFGLSIGEVLILALFADSILDGLSDIPLDRAACSDRLALFLLFVKR